MNREDALKCVAHALVKQSLSQCFTGQSILRRNFKACGHESFKNENLINMMFERKVTSFEMRHLLLLSKCPHRMVNYANTSKIFNRNNARVMETSFMLSKDNIELQFATNHVGHFVLSNLMLETMKKTAGETSQEGMIVNVSSRRHKFSYPEGIRFYKINDPSGYNSLSAYGQSKLANELARFLKVFSLNEEKVKITANSLHPGAIAANLFRHHSFVTGLGKHVMKNVHQGAAIASRC